MVRVHGGSPSFFPSSSHLPGPWYTRAALSPAACTTGVPPRSEQERCPESPACLPSQRSLFCTELARRVGLTEVISSKSFARRGVDTERKAGVNPLYLAVLFRLCSVLRWTKRSSRACPPVNAGSVARAPKPLTSSATAAKGPLGRVKASTREGDRSWVRPQCGRNAPHAIFLGLNEESYPDVGAPSEHHEARVEVSSEIARTDRSVAGAQYSVRCNASHSHYRAASRGGRRQCSGFRAGPVRGTGGSCGPSIHQGNSRTSGPRGVLVVA